MRLSEKIEFSINCFEQSTGLNLTLHDLENSFGAQLSSKRFFHSSLQCQFVKNSNYGKRCGAFELERLKNEIFLTPEGRYHICHAGLVEWAVPWIELGNLQWILFAGQRIASPELTTAVLDEDAFKTPEILPKNQQKLLKVNDNQARNYLELLCQLNARLRLICDEYRNHITKGVLSRSQEIFHYLENHFHEQIGLEDLANFLGLSHSRTAHLVKEVCGQNFIKLLNEIRIKRACVYLQSSKFSIAEIASRVGFGELSHFHHVFKKITGLTPRSFRFSS